MNFDDLPDQSAAPSAPPSFDALPDESKPPPATLMGTLKSSLTDVPGGIYEAGKSALSNIWEGEQQRARAAQANPSNVLTDWTGTNFSGLAAAPLTPVTKIGKAAAQAVAEPMTSAIQAVGTPAAYLANSNPALPSREDVYKQVEPDVETALALATPRASPLRAPTPLPAAPVRGPLGVTLSEGQATGNLSAIQREQGALRGTSGPGAQTRAQAFADQQRTQLEAARDVVARGLDPYGMQLAESPQEAGTVASQGVQGAANQARVGVQQAYAQARSYPGEIHAGVFEGMGQGIKGDLTLTDNPVIIDDKLTPFASRMVDDLDDRISQLRVQNKADPFGQPNPENITGVNLTGVEQMRKRLSAFRRGAFANNAEDGRAAQAIIDAFDNRIDTAVNGGMFNGDPAAVQAWNDARAAYSDYRGNFTAAKNDPVGKLVEKITGRNGIGPMSAGPAIPNDVADYLYGAAGTNPSSLNVGVANRVRDLLGEQSPEWTAVKQGLFRRLVEPGEGMTPWGPGRTAQRLNQFLNVDGREMAATMYSPNERAMLQNYADLLRRIEVPQAGANWSNTATFMARAVNGISGKLGTVVGAILGRSAIPIPFLGEAVGAGAANVVGRGAQAIQARAVARQMPLVAEQMQAWQRAMLAARRANTPPSRAAATAATLNLSRTLAPLGINFQQIAAQTPGSAYGGPNQQDVPGPVQKENGGRIEGQQRATGGKVGGDSRHKGPLNRGIGVKARRAKDGRLYIPDAHRPGKFLMVVPRVVH